MTECESKNKSIPDGCAERNNLNAYQVIDTTQMYAADAITIDKGISGIELITTAAQAVSKSIISKYRFKNVVVVCGSGNNGSDGFAVASILLNAGYTVTVVFTGDERDFYNLSGDTKIAAMEWRGETLFANTDTTFDNADLIVDAMLGAGINRAPSARYAMLITLINKAKKTVISIDLPTGVCGDTGKIFASAVNANMTVTFFRKKPAHLLLPGKEHCGELVLCDIGIDASVLLDLKPVLYENNPALWLDRYPFPDAKTHKYKRGHALVMSGERYTTGAARLAAAAALRIGAGVVTLGSPTNAMDVNAMHLTEIMQVEIDDETTLSTLLQDRRFKSFTLGPGLGYGERAISYVCAALEVNRSSACAIVLDADALSSFEQNPDVLFNAIKTSNKPVVMTPHTGEFLRLFNMTARSLDTELSSKVELTKQASAKSGAIIVYKGHDTVIACPDGTAVVNTNAPSWLATAGSGDVLAGTICGLLGQGLALEESNHQDSILTAFHLTCAAVWIHAQAANLFGIGLIAGDIHRTYPQVLSQLQDYPQHQ